MADELTLKDISEKMRDIDFAMLSTKTEGGAIAGRPMSNNRQVDYDGDNYFFTCEDPEAVAISATIRRSVSLTRANPAPSG